MRLDTIGSNVLCTNPLPPLKIVSTPLTKCIHNHARLHVYTHYAVLLAKFTAIVSSVVCNNILPNFFLVTNNIIVIPYFPSIKRMHLYFHRKKTCA